MESEALENDSLVSLHPTIATVWLVCSCISVLCCISVIFSYFSGNKQHPNCLIVFRAVTDLVGNIVLAAEMILLHSHGFLKAQGRTCRTLSFLTQFSFSSSELWMLALSFDLVQSLKNPFLNYAKKKRQYHTYIWPVALFLSILLITIKSNGQSIQGKSFIGICWTNQKHDEYNWANWFLYFNIIIFTCVYSLFALFVAFTRLKAGLSFTYRIRQRVIGEENRILSILIFYWFPLGSIYAWAYFAGLHSNDNLLTSADAFSLIFTSILGFRGVVTLGAWISVNGKKSLCGKKRERTISEQDGPIDDLSPTVNKALRREVLYFATQGIKMAVSCSHQTQQDSYTFRIPYSSAAVDATTVISPIFHLGKSLWESMTSHDIENPTQLPNPTNISEEKNDCTIVASPPTNWLARFSFLYHPDVEFEDFSPKEFRDIRQTYGIDDSEYINALLSPVKEKFTEGASGAFLYFSKDKKYIVKTMEAKEAHFLCENLPKISLYLKENPGSLITKFFGCHRITLYNNCFHFAIIENVFANAQKVNERYDIKGSWVNRNAKQPKMNNHVDCRYCGKEYVFNGINTDHCPQTVGNHEPDVVFKDNDLKSKIRLNSAYTVDVLEQLERDTEFLCSMNIMDYSLLVGIRNDKFPIQRNPSLAPNNRSKYPKQAINSEICHQTCALSPQTANSAFASEMECPGAYHFGMIDVLQQWDRHKKMESFFKSYCLRKDPHGISSVPPLEYRERFMRRMIDLFEAVADVIEHA